MPQSFPSATVSRECYEKGIVDFRYPRALTIFNAQAQEPKQTVIENWRCYGLLDIIFEKTVLVKATRIQKNGLDIGFGEVSVAGITYRAQFRVAGFIRRWNFGDSLNYAFMIDPEGNGGYYDFSQLKPGEKTSASRTYYCEK